MAYRATVVENHETASTHKCQTFDEAMDKVSEEIKARVGEGEYRLVTHIILSDKDLENLPSLYGRIQSKGGK